MPRILIIEPDRLLARNVITALSSAGHQVDWHPQSQSAINSADTNTPDLVVLDIALTFHSGVEFLYEFRSYPEWAAVPVVIFSSLPPEDINFSSSGFAHLGAAKFLPKNSTSLGELVAAVDQLLQPAN